MKFLRNFLHYIRGDVYITRMENRTFNVVCFISASINLAATINNLIIDVDPINFWLSIFGLLCYLLLYYASRFNTYRSFYPFFYMFFTQLYLSLFWFVNAGSEGLVITLFAAAIPMYLANTPNDKHYIVVSIILLNLNLLYFIEYSFPEFVIPYPSRETKLIDLGITNTIILIGLSFCVYIFKVGFDEEKAKNERNMQIVADAKSEIKVQKIIKNSIDAVISTDLEGKIVEWNYSATKIFGYSFSEVKNKKLSSLIIPDFLIENFEKAIQYFSEKTNFLRFETSALRKNGEQFPVELSFTLIEFEDKKILNFFIRDIKDQKINEQKILKKNEQLKSIYEEMDTLIYRSSHDLRGPVTNIQGLLELLPNIDNEHKQEVIKNISENTVKLTHILDQLSEYSKNHRNVVSFEVINVHQIVDEIKTNLAHLESISNLKINITEVGTYDLISDPIRLKTIFFNLIENAIIFNTKNKETEIDILIEKYASKALIRIKDNSDGIKQDHLPKVFNMFYRGSIKSVGAGLGLYVVKRIVTKLQGMIEIKSEDENGSEFLIELPNFVTSKIDLDDYVF